MNLSTQFIEGLNKLLIELDDKYRINSGGCCYIAYILSKKFDEFNIPYCLNIECHYPYLFNSNSRENVIGGEVTESANHYYLRYKKFNINNTDPDTEYIVSVSSKYIDHTNIKLIYDSCAWNTRYDASNNNKIKNILYDYFRQKGPRRERRRNGRVRNQITKMVSSVF